MIRWFCLAAAVLLSACATEPEPVLMVLGTVHSRATQAPIAGARVVLRYREPFAAFNDAVFLEAATTRDDGGFDIAVVPQPGHNLRNCLLLHLEVSAPGFNGQGCIPIGGADSPQCEAGAVQVPPIVLVPSDA